MLTNFRVSNFRCFQHTEVNLERVNLVAGRNNAGKTAFLEAIFLHLGAHTPELSLVLNSLRGLTAGEKMDAEEGWGWLFFNRELQRAINLQSTDEKGVARRVIATLLGDQPARTLPIPTQATAGASTEMGLARPLLFSFDDGTGFKYTSSGVRNRNNFRWEPATGTKVRSIPRADFLPSLIRSRETNARHFSHLEQENRHEPIVEALQMLDPRIKRLAVGIYGGESTIMCDLGIGRLMPIAYAGEGVVRLLSMMFALSSVSGGVLLVDEIENGFHHSVLANVWRVLGERAKSLDAQIVATTHSRECVAAAHEAFSAVEGYPFRLHRLDRRGDDVVATTYDQEMLEAALEHNFEVR